MIDFEWYRSFIYIYKYNSVSEAAKTRIMTQPAMSQHLAALEAEVGEPLFTRTARKMIPTERGKELYSQLAPLIESLEEATISFKTATSPTLSILRIGSAIEYYYENILNHLQDYKTCTVTHFGTADELLEFLKEGKVDIVITSKKYTSPGIEYVKLCEEAFVIVAPRHLQLPETQTLMGIENWLIAQNWISYGVDLPIIRRFWREYFKKRPVIKPIHIIPNLHLILKAIENGVGVSMLPTYLVTNSMNESKAKVIWGDYTVKNELFFAYQAKNKYLPDVIHFMNLLKGAQ
ncbi:LysR family transcriptional regulator [Paenibacillus hodogayensis]|uniref:LysR family transcriptional regulator n=1 Tax=Paenibacillus hodogayensis TaxID=279208 RepID=A0ABV5VPE2_9BACL